MTNEAISEAKAYIDRAISKQQELGYRKPKAGIVKSAVEDAAKAVHDLMRLQTQGKNVS